MKHTKHMWRIGLLVFFALIGFVFVRTMLVPESFGDYGNYRGANVAEQMALPVQHGEVKGCAECHGERVELLMSGKHHTVACENCHAPMATHAVSGKGKTAKMYANKTGNWCIRCHLELPGRPKTQPQIDPVKHLTEVGIEQAGRDWSDQVCFECHNPHNPEP